MQRSLGITLVAVAAALWGLDAWIRRPLAQSTDVATIVFGEHLVLVAITFPLLFAAWLIGVPDPFHPTAHGLQPTLYALAAATLWALGTVLGRYLSRRLRFQHVTALRFAFGLPASAIALVVLGAPAFASSHDMVWIAVLALVTGLVALSLY